MIHAATKRRGKAYRYYRCKAAMRNGHSTCPTKSVLAEKIETFVVDTIGKIGTDSGLQEVKARRRGLKVESKRLEPQLTEAKADVQRLVEAVSRTSGPAADAIAAELATAQKRVGTLQARQAEIQDELATLDPQAIDREKLTAALERFYPIWDVLLTRQKERVLQLLIERINYDGRDGKLDIAWRLAGNGGPRHRPDRLRWRHARRRQPGDRERPAGRFGRLGLGRRLHRYHALAAR